MDVTEGYTLNIVIVSGGFDPLHSGHIAYFEYAKKLKLPAYVIFPDKTLIEMAKYKPTNSEELEKIL